MSENTYEIKDMYGNPVSDLRVSSRIQDTIRATGDYDTDAKNGIGVYCVNGARMLLSSVGRTRVKFIGGLWRMQDTRHGYHVTKVRDKDFILGDKIARDEKNLFEYYHAAAACENCYGLIKPNFCYVVAKYDTKNGPMWAYGNTIEQARAFLGIALFDKHIDSIHAIERKNKK